MILEIQIAVSFLTSYLYNKLPRRRVDLFSVELAKQLKEKFEGHWYPNRPTKGSGYRCISIGDDLDPVLENSATDSGLSLDEIRTSLPDKLTMWIDPDEVAYRIEDQLVVKVIYQKDKYGESDNHNLAELEGFNTQQFYSVASTNAKETYNRSPIQSSPQENSPLSMLPSPNQLHYSLWSTEENISEPTTQLDSRLSPNAQEFRYPASKQHTPINSLPRNEPRLNEIPSYMWSSEQRQGYNSIQSFYNWLDNSNSYKRNYNSSQLEIMA